MNDPKSPIQSRTLWFNLALAVTALFLPKVHEVVSTNPQTFDVAFLLIGSVVNMVLRMRTTRPIGFPEKK